MNMKRLCLSAALSFCLGLLAAQSEAFERSDQTKTSWSKNWCAAVSRVKAGKGIGNVFIVGDSVTAGMGVQTMAETWPVALIDLCNRNKVSSREGVIWASNNANEKRWSYTGGWFQSGIPGGFGASGPRGAAGQAVVTPGTESDTVKVLYAAFPGGGQFTVKMDGVTTLGVINSNSAENKIVVQTYQVPRGKHSISFSNPTAQVYPVGVWFIDSTNPAIYITNSGYSGMRMTDWNVSGTWPRALYIAALQPDLCIFILGINDAQARVPESDFAAATNKNCTAVRAASKNTDVLLCQEQPGASAGGGLRLQAEYETALKAAAQQFDAGFLDLFNRWGGVNQKVTQLGYGNRLHPNALGMQDFARAVYEALNGKTN